MRKLFALRTGGIVAILVLCGTLGCKVASAGQGKNGYLPAAPETVQSGTRFLVRLDQEMNTGKDKLNKKFDVRTLEPLETSNGSVLPPGARISGHISRIEPAGLTGRARLWLTFDDIDTKHGALPIIAEVTSVPGDFSVRAGDSKEGEIEARTSRGHELADATAGGAAMGAAPGVTHHDAKAAAMGAAAGAAAAFLVSSGFGQELDLPKGTKLELILDRPLYLTQ